MSSVAGENRDKLKAGSLQELLRIEVNKETHCTLLTQATGWLLLKGF
jgi:hypothetical protein